LLAFGCGIASWFFLNGFEGHKIEVDQSFLRVGKGGVQSTLQAHLHLPQEMARGPNFPSLNQKIKIKKLEKAEMLN